MNMKIRVRIGFLYLSNQEFTNIITETNIYENIKENIRNTIEPTELPSKQNLRQSLVL